MMNTPTPEPNRERARLLTALDTYRLARQQMMTSLGLPRSNRDPLAEWSEQFVCTLLGGALAASRVQAAYDLTAPNGERVQVRYLANPADGWVNEHRVQSVAGVNGYALVLFEAFQPSGVLLFPAHLSAVCAVLSKRHPAQDVSLQFTRANWQAICAEPSRFAALGVRVWLPPFSSPAATTTRVT